MTRIEKTVFISYRRSDRWPALTVFKDLTQHGYDAFIDYDGIASGDFEGAILDNIRSRAHFVVLLTPTALQDCDDPADWLRREIEAAIAHKRNIVPVLLDGFEFSSPLAVKRLRGPLEPLKRYQGLVVPKESVYFDTAMALLRGRYLSVSVEAVMHPASIHAQQVAREQHEAASKATTPPQPTESKVPPADNPLDVGEQAALGARDDHERRSPMQNEVRHENVLDEKVEIATISLRNARAGSTTFRDKLKTGGEGPLMVIIPAGHFVMGSPPEESPPEEPEGLETEGLQHEVVIAQPFAMGAYAVSFEDYDRYCEATKREKPRDAGCGRGTRPVINVSWDDAQAYCAWLSEQSGHRYRLPSEAEWEYACRAGTTTPFYFGERISTDQANFNGNDTYNGSAKGEYREKTMPVGSFPANAFGLYEMHGNVWEWCQDTWHDSYEGAPADGSAWEGKADVTRVLRGGSWELDYPWLCRAACRPISALDYRDGYIGFRVCCSAPIE